MKWLQELINTTEESAYKVSFDCPVQKNPYKRANLGKANIPYDESKAFLDTPTMAEEYDLDQGARIVQKFIDKNLATQFFAMFWGREDVFAKRAKNGNYYPQCDNRWNNAICPKQKGKKQYCEDCEHTRQMKIWQGG